MRPRLLDYQPSPSRRVTDLNATTITSTLHGAFTDNFRLRFAPYCTKEKTELAGLFLKKKAERYMTLLVTAGW
jgi:hypothetical protein